MLAAVPGDPSDLRVPGDNRRTLPERESSDLFNLNPSSCFYLSFYFKAGSRSGRDESDYILKYKL